MMTKNNLAIISVSSVWGHTSNFVEAINLYSDRFNSFSLSLKRDNYGIYDASDKKHNFIYKENEEATGKVFEDCNTTIFIMGISGIKVILDHFNCEKTVPSILRGERSLPPVVYDFLKSRKVVFFWVDTSYERWHTVANSIASDVNAQTYSMLNLIKLDDKSLPLMQTYNLDLSTKYSEFTVAHSPGRKLGSNLKGSSGIIKTLNKLHINKVILGGESVSYHYEGQGSLINSEATKIKSKCHLFVDKVGEHQSYSCSGGVGQSGLESMYVGVPVMCSMFNSSNVGRYSDIPIVVTDSTEELERKVVTLRDDNKLLNTISEVTREWSVTTIDYKSTASYLEETII